MNKGVFGFPILLLYAVAIQLCSIYTYLHHKDFKSWVQIEESYIVWNKPTERPKTNNPYLHPALKLWDKFHLTLTSALSPLTSFLRQLWFSPAWSPQDFLWPQLSIYRICYITSSGALLSKCNLEHKCETNIYWFHYQQIYNIFHHLPIQNMLKKELSLLASLLHQDKDHVSGIISLIYKSVNPKT